MLLFNAEVLVLSVATLAMPSITKTWIRLHYNENPLGPSPRVLAAVQHDHTPISHYPDDAAHELLGELSQYTQQPPEMIFLGQGSSEILELIYRTFLTAENEVIISEHSFMLYRKLSRALQIETVFVPEIDLQPNLAGLFAAITPQTRLIILANPNSPTGSWVAFDALADFIRAIPESITIVIDEAYHEYMTDPAYRSAMSLLKQRNNLIIVRTFSKAFALAGLRIGYAVSSEMNIQRLKHWRKPFDVSRIAIVAALAALQDQEHLQRCIIHNTEQRQRLVDFFAQQSLPILANSANFVAVNFGAAAAAKMVATLREQGILVRYLSDYDLPDWVRISVGSSDENDHLLRLMCELNQHRT